VNVCWSCCSLALALFAAGCAVRPRTVPPAAATPEGRAIAFLQVEVPAWSRDNGCFSCHNNGDAARALLLARQQGRSVASEALAETLVWLNKPAQWDANKGDPGFSDARLGDVQFATALLTALETGQTGNQRALQQAALRVAGRQAADGSWPVGPPNTLGSPATYGTPLATHLAVQVLRRADATRHAGAIQRGQSWLNAFKPGSVLDAAVLLLAFRDESGPDASGNHASALALLRRAQTSDGGWGPYPDSPSEPFDTAMALLALQPLRAQPGVADMIQRGRRSLVARQQPDGSWPATTRPPGGGSYAQQMSTTGWATLALLLTIPN
jgi:hypothetical protein